MIPRSSPLCRGTNGNWAIWLAPAAPGSLRREQLLDPPFQEFLVERVAGCVRRGRWRLRPIRPRRGLLSRPRWRRLGALAPAGDARAPRRSLAAPRRRSLDLAGGTAARCRVLLQVHWARRRR